MPGIQQELSTYLWMDPARAAAHTPGRVPHCSHSHAPTQPSASYLLTAPLHQNCTQSEKSENQNRELVEPSTANDAKAMDTFRDFS